MIRKELDAPKGTDKRARAGHMAEKQMAFYLKRGFDRDENVHVFNGLRLEHEGDAVQVDHLLLHSHGFIIIESKSVHERVRVEQGGRWVREYKGQRHGMPSPYRQAERQVAYLKRILDDRREEVLGRVLGIQRMASARHFDILVAVSDDGDIRCDDPSLAPFVCKADEVVEAARAVMAGHGHSLREHLAAFGASEMDQIADFFLGNHQPFGAPTSSTTMREWPGFDEDAAAREPSLGRGDSRFRPATAPEPERPEDEGAGQDTPASHDESDGSPVCAKCGDGRALRIQHGPYGYYFKCGACGGNTRVQTSCPACGTPARLRKQGAIFLTVCKACRRETFYFVNPAEEGAAVST